MHKAFWPQICYMPCTHLCPVTFWERTIFVMIVIQLSTALCRQFKRGHCVVSVVSNKVEVNPMHTAQRWFWAESKQVQITQHFLIQHFNQTVGDVDHTDQNLDKYRIARCCCWSLLSTLSNAIIYEWLGFNSAFLNIHQSGVRTALFDCYMAGATWNCFRLGAVCVRHTAMHHVTSLHAKSHT